MHVPMRDVLATALVAVALIAYVAWLVGGFPVVEKVSSVALVVLVMGVLASMSAVVPGFAQLVHGSWLYMGIASVGGLIAAVAGVLALVNEDSSALAVLVLATIALWAMSTARHMSTYSTMHPVT
jgi:hypothetical protein